MKAEGNQPTRQRRPPSPLTKGGPRGVNSASSAALSTKPGSSTKLQHQKLAIAARKAGLDIHEVRKMVGGSLRRLSAAEASAAIERLGGGKLPHAPGQKPGPYQGKKKQPGVIRMIAPDHIEEISRLGPEAFGGSPAAFYDWLHNDFKVDSIQALATAERAGHVIRVLREMLQRKEAPHVQPL